MRAPQTKSRGIVFLSVTCLAAAWSAVPAESGNLEEAREVLAEGKAGWIAMHKQFAAVTATLHLTSEECGERCIPEPMRRAGMPIATGGAPGATSPEGAAGTFGVLATMEWDCELMWDRASANSVVQTRRVRHDTWTGNQLASDRPVLYRSLDGQAVGNYTVTRSSIDAGRGGDPSWQFIEDLERVRDFTCLTEFSGTRHDDYFDQLQRYVSPEYEGRYTVSVTGDADVRTLTIEQGTGQDFFHVRLKFQHMPFGWALTECEHGTPGIRWVAARYTYADRPGPGGAPVVVPVRSETEKFGAAHNAPPRRMTHWIVELRQAEFHPEPLTRQRLEEEVAARYGVVAADTMAEILRSGPVPVEITTMR